MAKSVLTPFLRLLEEAAAVHADDDHDHVDEFDVFNNSTVAEEDHHDDDASDSKPWGHVIAASLIVQLVTFSGVLLSGLVLLNRRWQKEKSQRDFFVHQLHQHIIPSFASGALLATAVFLLVPESFTLLQSREGGHEDESFHEGEEDEDHRLRYLAEEAEEEDHAADVHEDESYHWKFGVAILSGFILPVLLGAIFPPPDVSECEVCQRQRMIEEAEERLLKEQQKKNNEKNEPETIDLSCDEGNCCHNHNHSDSGGDLDPIMEEVLADEPDFSNLARDAETLEKQKAKGPKEPTGAPTFPPQVIVPEHQGRNIPLASSILLGDAFHNFTDGVFLGNAFLLCNRSVAYTIVATTVYHELAQEIADYALLITHCGLPRTTALALNFLSSFSTMIGALLILSLDMSNEATGIILAISAGVYLYIASSECVPRVMAQRKKAKDTLLFFICFVLGASPIGLVLLNHGHCEEAHEDH